MPPVILSFVHTKNPVVRGLISVAIAFVSTVTAVIMATLIGDLKSGASVDVNALVHSGIIGGGVAALTAFQAFLTPAPSQHLVSTSASTDTPSASL